MEKRKMIPHVVNVKLYVGYEILVKTPVAPPVYLTIVTCIIDIANMFEIAITFFGQSKCIL